jgi:hypothetical protein
MRILKWKKLVSPQFFVCSNRSSSGQTSLGAAETGAAGD